MGYKKKGSTASLKASGGFAAVLVLAGYLIGGPYTTVGLGLALGEWCFPSPLFLWWMHHGRLLQTRANKSQSLIFKLRG